MEFLQKIIMVPQNIIAALKNMRQQSQKVENIFIEPLVICYESKIETFSVIQKEMLTKRKKITLCQETQTEPIYKEPSKKESNSQEKLSIENNQDCKDQQSKSNKKHQKLNQKQSQEGEVKSQTSDKTEPSQYSYCQNHFLTTVEKNDEEYMKEQKKIYQPAKRKTSKQYRTELFNTYVNKLKEKYNDEKQILKSTRTQSSDEKLNINEPKEQEEKKNLATESA